ncbi:MAG TPA: integrin alpha, partial [Pseudobdellovibrionaceae bacterium]|nr:integrin alpha [Pseudobdellovibrionaceae bacterium]
QDMPVNTESCDGLIEGANCTAVRLTPDMGLIPQALLGGSPFRSITSIHSRFGEATSFIGDFNADGFDDIAIGAPTSYFWGHVSNFPGYVRSGMVAIYFGSQFGLGKENVNGFDLRFLPVMPPIPEQDMRFGASIHGGADVDGGYKRLLNKPSSPFHNKLVGGSDLIIGAPGFTYSNYTLGPLRNKVSNSPESH